MLAGLFVHLVAYVAVCGMLVAIWAIGAGGSFDQVREYVRNPDTVEASFWPVWVIVVWGAGLAIHLGSVVAFGLFGGRRRRERAEHRARRRRRAQREELVAHARQAAEIGQKAVTAVVSGLRKDDDRDEQAPPVPPAPQAPARRWVAVMFTDIVNSTQLNEALGDDEWHRLLRGHRELLRGIFLVRGGGEVNTQGDGFLARFDSPVEAVHCAVDIQRAIAEQREGSGVVPSVRIGIHAGEAVEDDGDLVGRVVNLASRVAGEAEPDEILVTEPVADALAAHRIAIEDRGVRPLKGIAAPRHLLSVVWQDVPPTRSSQERSPAST